MSPRHPEKRQIIHRGLTGLAVLACTTLQLSCGSAARPQTMPSTSVPMDPPLPASPARALDQRISVLTWKDGAQSALTLTFDDGTQDHATYALPILNSHGIKGTFFVITGNLGSGNWHDGTWDQFKAIDAAGHEIGSHTVTHPHLTQLQEGSETQVGTCRYELARAKADIEAHTGKPCVSVAYPYCDRSAAVDAITNSYYLAARNGGLDAGHPVWIPSSGPTWMNLTSYTPSFNARTSPQDDLPELALAESALAAAIPQQGWSVLMSHAVVPFDQIAGYGGYESQSTQWFTLLCDWIQSRIRSTEIWADTMGTITRYIRERDAARLDASTQTDSEISFTLVDGLDGALYDQPLTLEVRVPGGWTRVRVRQQDGSEATQSLSGAASQSLRLQARPGGGAIRIQRIN